MRLSVIVPVRNEAACIEATLTRLLEQDYDWERLEVLVVDGQSDDETVSIVRRLQERHANLRLLYNPRRFSSAARNVALHHATGDAVVVVDGHTSVEDPNYLRAVVRAFEESGAETLGRPQPLSLPNPTPFQRSLGLARQSRLGHNPDSSIYDDRARHVRPQNVAVAYRREVFHRVGFFDAQFDACEDVEFNHRVDQAGFRCWFTPAIRIDYHPRGTLRGLLFQMFRYGRGRLRLARKHRTSMTLPSLVPGAWLAWLGLTFGVGWVWPPAAAAFCLSLLLYASVVGAFSLGLALRHSATALVHVPFLIPAIHVGFGWGFLSEALTGGVSRAPLPPPTVRDRRTRLAGWDQGPRKSAGIEAGEVREAIAA